MRRTYNDVMLLHMQSAVIQMQSTDTAEKLRAFGSESPASTTKYPTLCGLKIKHVHASGTYKRFQKLHQNDALCFLSSKVQYPLS